VKTVFGPGESYTREASDIACEIERLLNDVLNAHPELSIREFAAIAHGSVSMVESAAILERRSKQSP